jgi:hypothetical protein
MLLESIGPTAKRNELTIACYMVICITTRMNQTAWMVRFYGNAVQFWKAYVLLVVRKRGAALKGIEK